ncbi:putative membrane protein [Acinetobacter baumannii 24845_9]|nr:putative membrane protein [Acinetobacter baumannii 24845_9]
MQQSRLIEFKYFIYIFLISWFRMLFLNSTYRLDNDQN